MKGSRGRGKLSLDADAELNRMITGPVPSVGKIKCELFISKDLTL